MHYFIERYPFIDAKILGEVNFALENIFSFTEGTLSRRLQNTNEKNDVLDKCMM